MCKTSVKGQGKHQLGVGATLCTMLDLEVKARLCMPSMPNTTPFYIETSVTKVNRKAWPVMEGCGDHRKNSGKGRLVTDGNGQPQTGVEKKAFYGKLQAAGSL